MALKSKYDDLLVQTEERLLEVQQQAQRTHNARLEKVQARHAEDRKEQAQLSEYTTYIKQVHARRAPWGGARRGAPARRAQPRRGVVDARPVAHSAPCAAPRPVPAAVRGGPRAAGG
jgi:hypothetical protein